MVFERKQLDIELCHNAEIKGFQNAICKTDLNAIINNNNRFLETILTLS